MSKNKDINSDRDEFDKLCDEYDSRISDLGEYGSGNIAYSAGIDKATKLLTVALRENCAIDIIYGDGIDEVKEYRFIPLDEVNQ